MRVLLAAFLFISFSVLHAQDSRNKKPKIEGQRDLEVNEDESITVRLSDLEVRDADNWFYPFGFTMQLYEGENYSFSGNTVIPSPDFFGELNVPVTVNDGEDDSEVFNLKIKVLPVNDLPVIVGQNTISTDQGESITITINHLIVTDKDDTYPGDFEVDVLSSNSSDYSVSGNTVTPSPAFLGTLSVAVRVNDGDNYSDVYNISIDVRPVVNDPAILNNLETEDLLYRIGEGDVAITRTAEVSDPDSDNLVSAVVQFQTELYQIGSDELTFQSTSTIQGEFNVSTGILSLKGEAPLSEYTEAIRRVKYNFIPVAESQFKEKTILITLNDGEGNGPAAERKIKITELDIALDIPNAFTPNGDHANDTWKIKPLKQSEELAEAVVRVYTKSGKLVFEGKGFEREWDGRSNGELLPADTYYYTIDLNLKFAKSLRSGLITLLR